MYISKCGEKLYLKNWEYNSMRLLADLAVIVENNGGTVAPVDRYAVAVNSTLADAIRHYEKHINAMQDLELKEHNVIRANAIKETQKKLTDLYKINNDPITVEYPGYITFKLDNMRYYFQIDSNPFFEHYFLKTEIRENNTYSRDAALQEIPCTIAYDCMLSYHITAADIKEIAYQVFNALIGSNPSPIIRDHNRRRVPNTYDGGYHYETVYAPEHISKMDF